MYNQVDSWTQIPEWDVEDNYVAIIDLRFPPIFWSEEDEEL